MTGENFIKNDICVNQISDSSLIPTMSSSYGISTTEAVSHYLRKLLVFKSGGGVEPQMPNVQVDFLEELHYSVNLVAKAIENKSICNKSVTLSDTNV